MAAKVQLDIESKANTQALKQAIADLEKLGMAGKSTNQVFGQTNNLEGYKAALVKSYETARTFGDQMKATRTAFSDTSKAIKAAQAYLGQDKNNMFTFIDEKGMQQQTRDMALIEKQVRGFLGNVVADTQNFKQSMTRNMGEFMDADKFTKGLQKTSDAYKLMGNDLGAVQYKMTAIQQQILDMSTSYGDPKEIQKLATEYKNLTKEHEELAKAQNGTSARIKNLIKNFVSAQLIVWALRSVVSGLTKGLKEASTAAAEAEQVFGRFDAVFEGLERANAAVSEMVDNFGVAKSSAADILSSIGNTALGFGASAMEAAQFSETVAKSLSDIMAFRDVQGTISDFAERFMSGASGNVQNFRALGSVVRATMVDLELQKQGWENLTGQALEWAKVQARVNIVLEQQKKAIGATEREWETMLSIQRRHKEQTKELKENIGKQINEFFKPMSEWILTLKENWNAALQAKEDYINGKYDPIPEENYKDSPTARVLRNELIAERNLQSRAMATLAGGSFNITELEQVRDFAERFGATLRYTAEEAVDVGFKISDSVWEQIDAYDAYIKKINDARKAENARLAASKAEYEGIRDFFADVGSMMGMGGSGSIYDVRDYVKKDPADFVSPLERLLGFEGGEEAELEAKIKGLSNMVESLFNTSISGSSEYIRTQAAEMLKVVAPALSEAKKLKTAIESATAYGKAKSSIEDELASMQKRNELEAQYGKDNEDIINIKLQQWQAEQNALSLFQERLRATGDGKKSNQEYLDLMELISQQYGIQLGRAEDIAKAEFTKSYQDRVDALKETYDSLKLSQDLEKQYGSERAAIEQERIEALQKEWRYMSEQVKLGMDATEANEMYLDSAKAITAEYELQLGLLEEQSKVKRGEALQEASKAIAGVIGQRALVGASDKQRTQARIDEQVYAFAESLTQGGTKLKETLDQTAEYRRQLEMLAAEEAHQAVIDSITSAWEGTGDVGMIKGWVEAFAEGGTMEGIAKVATDLLTSFESVNELLSIVTKFIEYVAPAVDQFLTPLMPVLEMILSITADILLPILQILFPIIQGLSIALIYLMAVIKTVTNSFSWLVDTIATAIYNIIHPFKQRAFRNLGDETVEIWSNANAKVEEIWNMEIDTRLEFVGQLSDAQKGQLDAYNEMFKSGLLTLTQYQAMVGKNVYGKNFDNVDIQSFASGGDFITNGEQIIRVGEAGREHVTVTPLNSVAYANRGGTQTSNASYSVVVNGANGDPEAIAMAVRREFKRMERRGVAYA